jgi:hypothetical protein
MKNIELIQLAEDLGKKARSESAVLSSIAVIIKTALESPDPDVARSARKVAPAFLTQVSMRLCSMKR